MDNSNNNRSSAAGGGLSILGVVEIVFIILKLLGIINWSWWIVLIPLWIELGITLLIILVIIIVAIIMANKRK